MMAIVLILILRGECHGHALIGRALDLLGSLHPAAASARVRGASGTIPQLGVSEDRPKEIDNRNRLINLAGRNRQ